MIVTTEDMHQAIHKILVSREVAADINAVMKAKKHQVIEYGKLANLLHLHYLCHALSQDSGVFIQVGDSKILQATSTYRPNDSIGRAMHALVIKAD